MVGENTKQYLTVREDEATMLLLMYNNTGKVRIKWAHS